MTKKEILERLKAVRNADILYMRHELDLLIEKMESEK